MDYVDIRGKWKNEFGSLMHVTDVDEDTGIFSARYSSTTGASGTYRVTGLTDTRPEQDPDPKFTQTIAFAVSWRDLGGSPADAHWMSAFSGQIQMIDGQAAMRTTYLLQKSTAASDDWEATAIATATFRRVIDVPRDKEAGRVVFPLTLGKSSNNGGTPWTSTVGIGSPPQLLKVMLDSGTVNTWVTSTRCQTAACMAHRRFDAQDSDSYRVVDNQPQSRNFGPWGTMRVVIGADRFHLEHVSGKEPTRRPVTQAMPFEAAIDYAGEQFQQLDCDGGIAIPLPSSSKDGTSTSLIQQLLLDGKIDYPVAAFWSDADRGTGECVFGAIDPDKYMPDTLQWLPAHPPGGGLDYLWAVDPKGFHVDGRIVDAGITRFVFDSGSSYFKGPEALIEKLVAAVTDHHRLPVSVTSARALDNYPVISIALGNQSYELRPQQYFMKLDDDLWQLGIEVLDGMPDGMLLVGSVLMDTLYCVFDLSASAVGIARRTR
jgi:hypothetical protein